MNTYASKQPWINIVNYKALEHIESYNQRRREGARGAARPLILGLKQEITFNSCAN